MTTIDPNYQLGFSYQQIELETRKKIPELDLRIYLLVSSSIIIFVGVCVGWKLALVASAICFVYFSLRNYGSDYYITKKKTYVPIQYALSQSEQRDRQIFIHHEIVADKLSRGLARASQMEASRAPQGFVASRVNLIKRWSPKTCETHVRCGDKEQVFTITASRIEDLAFAQSKGRKLRMEDVVLHQRTQLNINDAWHDLEILAVLDGHRGVPGLTIEALSDVLFHHLQLHCATAITPVGICNSLIQCTVDLKDLVTIRGGGSTLVLALVLDGNLWVANLGDSRALAILTSGEVISLTEDARVKVLGKPDRINDHFVKPALMRGGRIRGASLLSQRGSCNKVLRTLGDRHFPGNTGRAKITVYPIEQILALVMGTDGLFARATNLEIGGYIHKLLEIKRPITEITARTVQLALAAGSKDNLTCLVKRFRSVISNPNGSS